MMFVYPAFHATTIVDVPEANRKLTYNNYPVNMALVRTFNPGENKLRDTDVTVYTICFSYMVGSPHYTWSFNTEGARDAEYQRIFTEIGLSQFGTVKKTPTDDAYPEI